MSDTQLNAEQKESLEPRLVRNFLEAVRHTTFEIIRKADPDSFYQLKRRLLSDLFHYYVLSDEFQNASTEAILDDINQYQILCAIVDMVDYIIDSVYEKNATDLEQAFISMIEAIKD